MKILFDQGTPVPLRVSLKKHVVVTAYEAGWSDLKNGDLITAAEVTFDLLITTDQSLKYQQNLAGRRLSILVLMTTSWPRLREHASSIASLADEMKSRTYREFSIE